MKNESERWARTRDPECDPMLVRISCERCGLSSLWTDDPKWFLETICARQGRCEAVAVAEGFGGVVIRRVDSGLLPCPR